MRSNARAGLREMIESQKHRLPRGGRVVMLLQKAG